MHLLTTGGSLFDDRSSLRTSTERLSRLANDYDQACFAPPSRSDESNQTTRSRWGFCRRVATVILHVIENLGLVSEASACRPCRD